METQKLKSILLTQAQNLGADLCGIADLTADSRWIQETYGDLCASFPRAVSIAIFFPREIIQEQAVGPTRSYSYFYTAINRQLDTIGFRLSNFLQQRLPALILSPPPTIAKPILSLDCRSRLLLKEPTVLRKCRQS